MMGMPNVSTISRAQGNCGISSGGVAARCALYSENSSWRKVRPGGSNAAIAYVGRWSLSALKSIDVKPKAALVISPRLLLSAGIAKKAR